MAAEYRQANITGLAMSAHQVAELLSAKLVGTDASIHGVSTDTRTIMPGQLFVALKGPNFDGHAFVEQAISKGASCCLVQQVVEKFNCIVVKDTHAALGQLARAWREKLALPVVAVTGSNGKTTVKEMIANILAQAGRVHATRGNLNNDIGVPLTLLEIDAQDNFAVVEMGANHAGEIAYLTELAQPDVAIITNAGAAHLEGFGSLQGVARAKGEIFSGLGASGTAIVNNDDTFADYWKELNRHRQVITFGVTTDAQVSATWKVAGVDRKLHVVTPQGELELRLHLLGQHNVVNALAAIAATCALDIPLTTIKQGLEKMRPVSGRLQLKPGLADSRIIDDTYNANPSSWAAALDVLVELPGRHFVALGDMGELGADTEQLHAEAGLQARQKGIERLFTIGELAHKAADKFGRNAEAFTDQLKMIERIKQELANDVTLLVKGSRLSRMDKVVAALVCGGEN